MLIEAARNTSRDPSVEFVTDGEALQILTCAKMNVRFAAGGEDAIPVTPGQPVLAKMEFLPVDVALAPGGSVVLVVSQGRTMTVLMRHAPAPSSTAIASTARNHPRPSRLRWAARQASSKFRRSRQHLGTTLSRLGFPDGRATAM